MKNLGMMIAGLACALGTALPAHAVDADAALARQNNCFKCHSVDKKKDGPAYRDVATKYKSKADAQDRLVKHLTPGEKAKFPDGHEEDHKIVKAKDSAEVKNFVDWILAQ